MFRRVLVDISMMVICNNSDIIEYDRRIFELSNAPLHLKQYTSSTEKIDPSISFYPD